MRSAILSAEPHESMRQGFMHLSAQNKNNRPQKNQVVEVEFESVVYGGQALARHDGYVIFSKYGAPGDTAKVRLTKSKKSYGEAVIEEIVRPSEIRTEPRCPLFGSCGGCSWQHMSIPEQEKWKERIVSESLRTLEAHEEITVKPIVSSPSTWRYRNKAEFTFKINDEGKLVGGFHTPGNWWQILDVENCYILPEEMERILRVCIDEAKRQKLTAWDSRKHTGTLRQIVIRHSVHEDSYIALLLTGDRKLDFKKFSGALMSEVPKLKGVVWGINAGKSDVARAQEVIETSGEETFDEVLGSYHFRVSLASFFQTNTLGAEKLYSLAKDALELSGEESLLDAYCGTGTIGIYCSDKVKNLYGIEIVQEAIWDARSNAKANNVKNALFMAGDMKHTLPVLLNAVPERIDRLVVDPPRSGMDKKALKKLLALQAPIIAYVSCNPTTMVRDLQEAQEAGYVIEYVIPVDMFPHTYHVECVAKLRLKTSRG